LRDWIIPADYFFFFLHVFPGISLEYLTWDFAEKMVKLHWNPTDVF